MAGAQRAAAATAVAAVRAASAAAPSADNGKQRDWTIRGVTPRRFGWQ